MQLLFSVIVPTYRRPALLQRCLTALSKQTCPREQFEVLVVDDGNDTETAEAVKAFGEQAGLRVSYLGQPQQRGPAAARNRGWRAAQGQFIAFTDDDCLPEPDWLVAAQKRFEAGALVLSGRVVMPLPDQPTAHERTTALLETAEFVTANCFCRRSALERVGGFNEAFDIAWREDSALQFQFLESGIPIEPCPEAVIIHPMRPSPWYAPLKDERKNQYDALLFKYHPELFRERISQYEGLVTSYYGTVLSALLTAGGIATGNRIVAKAGGLSWALLTAGLLAKRQSGQPIDELPQNLALTAATPFLSVYWRLYGALKHRVWRL